VGLAVFSSVFGLLRRNSDRRVRRETATATATATGPRPFRYTTTTTTASAAAVDVVGVVSEKDLH
jgi:hypothetical protein